MAAPSTKQHLLALIEDVEIVTKELFEVLSTPKSQKADGADTSQLLQLLIMKDKEIKDGLKLAEEQAEIQKKMDALKAEVEKRDQDIKHLQKSLKESETILASAIYQAKQKLKSISRSNAQRISSEELIKYAHRISASNAVAAPPTWTVGDPRRPYPTDLDMRCGYLGRINDLNISSQSLQSQASYSETLSSQGRSSSQMEHMSSQSNSIHWQPPHDLGTGLTGPASASQASTPKETKGHNKENEDVELMSSDSSSSSSSDE